MGYTTEFFGHFDISPTLKEEHRLYLTMFTRTRRQRRNGFKTEQRPDPIRFAANLPVGPEGEYFVGETGFMGQDTGPDVLDGNNPPVEQPGLWCHWAPNLEGDHLLWDGGEKFYDYCEWLEYIIEHFLYPWGYRLDGKVSWEGEDEGDTGTLVADGHVVRIEY
jgi:hypothetical protein